MDLIPRNIAGLSDSGLALDLLVTLGLVDDPDLSDVLSLALDAPEPALRLGVNPRPLTMYLCPTRRPKLTPGVLGLLHGDQPAPQQAGPGRVQPAVHELEREMELVVSVRRRQLEPLQAPLARWQVERQREEGNRRSTDDGRRGR